MSDIQYRVYRECHESAMEVKVTKSTHKFLHDDNDDSKVEDDDRGGRNFPVPSSNHLHNVIGIVNDYCVPFTTSTTTTTTTTTKMESPFRLVGVIDSTKQQQQQQQQICVIVFVFFPSPSLESMHTRNGKFLQ